MARMAGQLCTRIICLFSAPGSERSVIGMPHTPILKSKGNLQLRGIETVLFKMAKYYYCYG